MERLESKIPTAEEVEEFVGGKESEKKLFVSLRDGKLSIGRSKKGTVLTLLTWSPNVMDIPGEPKSYICAILSHEDTKKLADFLSEGNER